MFYSIPRQCTFCRLQLCARWKEGLYSTKAIVIIIDTTTYKYCLQCLCIEILVSQNMNWLRTCYLFADCSMYKKQSKPQTQAAKMAWLEQWEGIFIGFWMSLLNSLKTSWFYLGTSRSNKTLNTPCSPPVIWLTLWPGCTFLLIIRWPSDHQWNTFLLSLTESDDAT